jgi:hypothetical protein
MTMPTDRRRESFDAVAERYDRARPDYPRELVAVATAFHWLDPAMRLNRCANALRAGGTLAIVETHSGVDTGDDRFFRESQACWARFDPDHDPSFRAPRPEDLSEECDDLARSPLFEPTAHRRYGCTREYDAAAYCALLDTFSNVRAFEPALRTGFLACIADLIETRFEGRIVRHDVYDLWLAHRR